MAMLTLRESPSNATSSKNHWPFLWVGLGLLIAAIAGLGADTWVARTLNVERLPGDLRRFLGLTEFFAHGVGVFFVGWFIWHTSPTSRRYLPRLLACALLPGLAVNLIKLSVCRLRPAYFRDHLPASISDTWVAGPLNVFAARTEYGTYFVSSFPSGHAATAFGLALGLSWLCPTGRIPFFTLAVLSTIQRMSGGAHWLSDTLVGASLAVLIAGSLTAPTGLARIFDRFEANRPPESTPLATRKAA